MTTKKTTTKPEAKAKSESGKRGYTYKGQSFGMPGDIVINVKTFYSLYRRNTDVRMSVQKISDSVGKGGYRLVDTEGKTQKNPEIENSLRYLDLHKSTISRDLWIGGNGYATPVYNAFGAMVDLQILDPRTMYVVADKHGEILAYIQRNQKGEQELFLPEEIYHLIDSRDHDNEILGISRMETLVYEVMSDEEAMKSNYSFFKNSAIPSSIIVLDETLGETEVKNAIAQLKEQFKGGENRHKITANIGIKDIKQVSSSMKDMEFMAMRKFTTDKVCTAMGVPKTILGYHEGVNFSNSEDMYRVFIEETVRPLEVLLSQYLTQIIQKEFETDLRFEFIDNRNFDRKEKIEETVKLIDSGLLTINEGRDVLGRDRYTGIDNVDQPIIKNSYTSLDDLGLSYAPGSQTTESTTGKKTIKVIPKKK